MTCYHNAVKNIFLCKNTKRYFFIYILLCEKCDYNTSRKSSYTKHLLSAKHCQVTFGDDLVAKSCIKYKCENCDKNYSSRNGLWKHKKICSTNIAKETTIEKDNL